METFSALLALCAGNSPVTGELPPQRPVTWSFDVFFENKRMSKQSRLRWFVTFSCLLWRHSNAQPWYSWVLVTQGKHFNHLCQRNDRKYNCMLMFFKQNHEVKCDAWGTKKCRHWEFWINWSVFTWIRIMISNYIHSFVSHVITHQCLNLIQFDKPDAIFTVKALI